MLIVRIVKKIHCLLSFEVTVCMLNYHLLIFKQLTSSKSSFRNTIRVSSSLDLDRSDILSSLIWVKTVCKGYQ